MFFELTNASATFQSYIHLTLREYLDIFCIVYLNDVLIYLNDKNTHEKHVWLIFKKLCKFKLFTNLKKCYFDLDEIDYLEYLINIMKIKISFVKVQIIKIWFKSKSFKNIQIFIKFVNFYKRFINKFNSMTAFLIDMLKKSKKEFFFRKFWNYVNDKESVSQFKKRFFCYVSSITVRVALA